MPYMGRLLFPWNAFGTLQFVLKWCCLCSREMDLAFAWCTSYSLPCFIKIFLMKHEEVFFQSFIFYEISCLHMGWKDCSPFMLNMLGLGSKWEKAEVEKLISHFQCLFETGKGKWEYPFHFLSSFIPPFYAIIFSLAGYYNYFCGHINLTCIKL